MRQLEAMIAFNTDSDEIEVGPWPDRTGWSSRYRMTIGACMLFMHDWPEAERKAQLFIDFNTIVVRDRVPVDAAHAAFLKIDEYRQMIAPDMKGAERRGII